MTQFENGPAAGETLMLRRCPRFLRVVQHQGEWDALDQWEDTPEPDEEIYAYVRQGEAGSCFIDGRGCSGMYAFGTYKFSLEQPTDEIMRDTMSWQKWCLQQTARIVDMIENS
jgi:hypothetical protein